MKKSRIAMGTAMVAVLALLFDAFLQFAGNKLQTQEEIDAQNNVTVEEAQNNSDEASSLSVPATVERVVDGDTIVVMLGEAKETVRFIGLNAPETVDPKKEVECYGPEASAALKSELAPGDAIVLIADETQENRDKYGRLLRYVEEGDQDIGLWLIQNGYAEEHAYDGMFTREEKYKAAEENARENNVGQWGEMCQTR